MENVLRNLGNFTRIPLWNCIMTKDEVNYLLDNFDNWTLCNGKVRDFVFNKITENRFKVFTKMSSI